MNDTDRRKPSISRPLHFRPARPDDGAALWRLVGATGALELNSAYFYLLFAADFGDTCLVAEHDGRMVGAVVGYHPPRQTDTAFVWQIGVLPEHRGQGLGLKLLQEWSALPANRGCRWVTATVADDNTASQALFRRFARDCGTDCAVSPLFTADMFPCPHPAEPLYRIGPLDGSAP
ncbi:diaminobutyrate acetyltransferase [Thauera linaloolentis]|uniref:L-2,4-diaminobutyric acid acetyltransferase n=1 Tax=Thauera linaloolentis (strain DSM 12138 / JCM 21573 / CCUG 41526 / CIP 105981 / IAM 15112 / NBRC 102519 / 47Lol) TaxID=1123367 RepID=N6Y4K0_THAL4|nr:diaminobutyrate acetyltransferase [Thauera linaloolentis]ENO89116.1 L-2,4-diaminobutyric acid acetyltransferase [Thauera linaloolentis 47Lol = DSM 12138]MCM8565737.1 diaminobutyrate acetyltransferase [Thauera linaloolentis]